MIDTVPPQIQFTGTTDTGAAAAPNTPIVMSYKIIDNITNIGVTYSYSKGLNLPVDHTASFTDTALIIPADSVTTYGGVRAFITINDGRNNLRLNVSRQVTLSQADLSSVDALKWLPLKTTSALNNPALSSCLDTFSTSPWKYDPIHFRVFQWGFPSAKDTTYRWIEYSDNDTTIKNKFVMKPGGLFWLKSQKQHPFNQARENCFIKGHGFDFCRITQVHRLRDTLSIRYENA